MRTAIYILLLALFSAGCEQEHKGFSPAELGAVQEARASLTNFLSALAGSKSNLTFCQVCAPCVPVAGGPAELVWFNVGSYDGSSFGGLVVEAKPGLGLTNGQPALIAAANIVDWAYLSRTGMVGLFLDHARH